MTFSILMVFLYQGIIPGVLIYALWRGRDASYTAWLLKALYTGAFIAYVFVTGRWDWTVFALRYVMVAIFLAAAFISYRRVQAQPALPVEPGKPKGGSLFKGHGPAAFTLLGFLAFLTLSLRGYLLPSGQAVSLAFPLREGTYYVAQGGSASLLNQHYSHPAQRYALDVVALNPYGLRAEGIYPTALERYVIFGHPVSSPCDGNVTIAVDGLPDLTPPEADSQNPAGNHVVIACQDTLVLLAHLKQGSLRVGEGDVVATGQILAQVGNTGNTSEPHLHIHAVRAGEGVTVLNGEGVPLLFDGMFLVRNAIIKN